MKDKLLSFVVLPSIMFALFLAFSPVGNVEATASSCVATACGTSVGTKTVPVIEEVCDKGCPTITFRAYEMVCPAGYPYESSRHDGYCYKTFSPDWPEDYKEMVKSYYGPTFHVKFEKSSDPHKCHRPSDSDLKDEYGMNHSTRQLFKDIYHELLDMVDVNCHNEQTGTEEVACNDAPIIPCAESCPTDCGYPGGTVPDGKGGVNTCEPTNSCSTYRWCYPATEEDNSPTGFIAKPVSVSIPNPEIGKPWDAGKMIDQFCAYPEAETCPTECGYEGGDEVADGQGGTIKCEATAACEVPVDDEPEVLGEEDDTTKDTGVVLAATGPTDNIVVYIVELLLVAILVTYSVFFTKTYLKNSK